MVNECEQNIKTIHRKGGQVASNLGIRRWSCCRFLYFGPIKQRNFLLAGNNSVGISVYEEYPDSNIDVLATP